MNTIAIPFSLPATALNGLRAACLLAATLLLLPDTSNALPRFSLQSGQSCASCHVNISGGGQRTEGGWWSMKRTGLIDPEGTVLAPLYGAESNTIFSPMLSWGFDYRFQIARRGFPTLERDFFSMQLAPYLSFTPIEGLTLYGAYNLVPPEYKAQQHGYGGVTYTPVDEVTVKAGLIQPNFGVRHDDHTTFTRIHAGIGYVPYYAELGGEVYVSPLEWLTVSGGLYQAKNRSELVPNIDGENMFYTANMNIVYPDFDNNMSYALGASLAQYNEQTLIGASAGFGLIDRASILVEYVRRRDDFTKPLNPQNTASGSYVENGDVYLVKLSYEILEGLAFVGRWEQAKLANVDYSDGTPEREFYERQWVAGLQVFVLPNLELRPEYRWLNGSLEHYSYTVGQYTLQVHLFY